MNWASPLSPFRMLLAGLFVFTATTLTAECHAALTPDQAAGVRASIENLKKQHADFSKGKRSPQDGYVILHRLAINYSLLDESTARAAKRVLNELRAMEGKMPALRQLQDMRLSEEIQEGDRLASHQAKLEQMARYWQPRDTRTERLLGDAPRYVGVRQYALDFFELGAEFKVGIDRDWRGGRFTIRRSSEPQGAIIPVAELNPTKTIQFRHRIEVLSGGLVEGVSHLLVCSQPLWQFTPQPGLERDIVRVKTGREQFDWENPLAEGEDFCGVIASDGAIRYRFPVEQRRPAPLIQPIAISKDGRVAAIAVGREVPGEFDAGAVIGDYEYALIWRESRKPIRIDASAPEFELMEIRNRVLNGQY